ncbi:CHAT domain protein [Ceratobasidium sp. AG-Ba]|nr:CHAT domain protein [Ceratobasidium sp. AG-Ba]
MQLETMGTPHEGQHYPTLQVPQQVSEIEHTITIQKNHLSVFSLGDPGRVNWLATLGTSYQRLFEYTKKRSDIVLAVYYLSEAVNFTPKTDSRMRIRLENLAISLYHRSLSGTSPGEDSDINKSMDCQLKAMHLTPQGHKDLSRHHFNLGGIIMRKYSYSSQLSQLEEAIAQFIRAISTIPESHAERSKWLNDLGVAYSQKFTHTAQLEDLECAIQYQTDSIQSAPNDNTYKSQRLNNISNLLLKRFDISKSPSDLDKAATYLASALMMAETDYSDRLECLSGFGHSYAARFDLFGNMADLERAIKYQRHIVDLTPHDHADRCKNLLDIGHSFSKRFERGGELIDIDTSINFLTQAHSLVPTDHANRATYLDMLGNSYLQRFQRLREAEDLHQAINYHTEAVSLTPDDHASRPKRLESLGSSYRQQFELSQELGDIDRAIDAHRGSASLTPPKHVHLARRLDSLGSSLRQRFEQTRVASDLEEALECHSRAVGITPDEHVHLSKRLDSLGQAYRLRFENSGIMSDINEAVKHHRRAVSQAPEDHANNTNLLHNLATALSCRFEFLGELTDLQEAIDAAKRATYLPLGSPLLKFTCARLWAKLEHFRPSSALLDAYQEAMNMLPRMIWLGTRVERRQQDIRFAGNIATEAAASAIAHGAHDLALEWLEEGASILWKQVLQLRTPLDSLREIEPNLAHQLQDTSRVLNHAHDAHRLFEGVLDEYVFQERRRAAERWDRLIAEARNLPGFENFLKPRKAQELLKSAHSSTVVVINVHVSRCDALAILQGSSDIMHIPLPSFSEKMAVHALERLNMDLGKTGAYRGASWRGAKFARRITNFLEGDAANIWAALVEPVLRSIGFIDRPYTEEPPHITWRATGPLAFVPLHGAGIYTSVLQEATFDYVVSSYTPTLSSLLVTPPDTQDFSGILLVGAPTTPGQESLPEVEAELASAKHLFQQWPITVLVDDLATTSAVLGGMKQHSWVHFACHAYQNHDKPLNSAFFLNDGPLDVGTIASESLGKKGVAFLSACTTIGGDQDLPEESINLASGMLVAGYSTVIATMWSIRDDDAAFISRSVYEYMLRSGQPSHRNAAQALRWAVSRLRERVGVMEFGRWLPFVHIGQ